MQGGYVACTDWPLGILILGAAAAESIGYIQEDQTMLNGLYAQRSRKLLLVDFTHLLGLGGGIELRLACGPMVSSSIQFLM